MNADTLVVGVGSPAGSDRLGWQAVEQIRERVGQCPEVAASTRFVMLDRPGPMLIEYFEGSRRVVVLDAIQAGLEPGTLMRLEGSAIDSAPLRLSSHGYGVADAVGMARALGVLPPRLVVWGMEVGRPVQSAVADDDVERLVEAVLGELGLP